MSAVSMRTTSPASRRTVVTPPDQCSMTPRTSVIRGPPEGPVSPRSTRRTTTRSPTQSGPSEEGSERDDTMRGIVPGGGPTWTGRDYARSRLTASTHRRRRRRNLMTYVIAQPCVDLKDRACVDECPVDCIYEGKRMLYIHPDECVDCGACEPVCPVEAIFYEDDTPEQWKDYYDANVHFFDDLGSPGGAAKMGEIDKDHPLVAALPPQEHDE